MNSDVESNFVFKKSKFSKLLLKINKIKSLLILLFLFFKFPFTKKLSFFFLIFKYSESKFILLNSNKIYVIDAGKVVGEGNHESLIKSSDIYKNFYEKQIRKD